MDIYGGAKSKFAAVGEIAEDVLELMEELYQSGFDTVHDSTLQGMEKAVKQTGQYGMKYLSGLLGELTDEISIGRHQMEKKTARMTELYTEISEYLYLCRQKAAYDYGREQYVCGRGRAETELE